MKRFYETAEAQAVEGGWQVMLDGRAVKTQGGRAQVVHSQRLGEAMAAEWAAQGNKIDPKGFVLRDLVDHAIDNVAPDPGATVDRLLRYAETDTLCYRADPEDALFKRQQEVWEPLVAALEAREGIRLERVSGVVARPPSDDTIEALRRRLAALPPLELAAVDMMTSLAASLCVALAAIDDDADPDRLWDAAELEESWQADLWGKDEEAEERRAERRANFRQAFDFARLARR
ncbi:ATPase [Blastomonas marina]|uniref:ATPase n=1 Tax=Blastomonas marina TaxID=1867408 RepID=A0ABQ1FFW6_9SPHN|nr:ATP12 family protein [Blastomonas marina]GGA08845.1 ATPase [Blastomonas marina]